MPHIFNVKERRILDSEDRSRITEPFSTLIQSDLKKGMKLVDLGCGTGFFAIPASRITEEGTVYAIDVQTEMLKTLNGRVKKLSIGNIYIIRSDLHKLPLRDRSLDLAILMNALHEVSSRQEFLREVSRILKAKGKLSLIDWKRSRRREEFGPPLKERISKGQAQKILEHKYFKLAKEFKAGPYHYGLLFFKK